MELGWKVPAFLSAVKVNVVLLLMQFDNWKSASCIFVGLLQSFFYKFKRGICQLKSEWNENVKQLIVANTPKRVPKECWHRGSIHSLSHCKLQRSMSQIWTTLGVAAMVCIASTFLWDEITILMPNRVLYVFFFLLSVSSAPKRSPYLSIKWSGNKVHVTLTLDSQW